MAGASEILKEYDILCDEKEDEYLEAWLKEKIANYASDDLLGKSALINELGSFYRARKRLEESREAFEEAARILETPVMVQEENDGCCHYTSGLDDGLFGYKEKNYMESADYATIINNLAGTFRLMKDYKKAIELFNKSISIYNKLDNVPAGVYCSVFNNIALVYMDQGDFEKAVHNFREIKAYLQDKKECFRELSTTDGNMAVALIRMGKKEEALECCAEAVKLYRDNGYSDSYEVKTLLNLQAAIEGM